MYADPREDAIRRWAYLQARYDPLGRIPPASHPSLEDPDPALDRVKRAYLGPLAAEFMHLPDPDRCRFIAERVESDPAPVDARRLLEQLVRADLFEQVLQSHYVGTKRFSLEGMTALIPLLDAAIREAAEQGAEEAILGMSHRGRLNVIVHVLGKRARDIFARFEDSDPESVMGSGDVKYHLGASGALETGPGRRVRLELAANPSHLEAVDPVVQGVVRARQDRRGPDGRRRVLPLLLHGDAALAGQGVAAETLNQSSLSGYTVGGTIHVVLNNLIGFTTPPRSLYSSPLATDVARRLPIPILHVSAEDPLQVVRAARLAAQYRSAFESDVVVDLVGYRRHGHSEVDDPTTTQPRLYRKIAALPPLWKSAARSLGTSDAELAALSGRIREELERELAEARTLDVVPPLQEPGAQWAEFKGGLYDPGEEVFTSVSAETLRDIGRRISAAPAGFHVHPKVAQGLSLRREMAEGKRAVDWGMAEALAFGSLLREGIGVRLAGQDTRRGTFNHRHAALIDTETEQHYVPLNHLGPETRELFEVVDSPLSEAAPLGFEYGYSRDFPERLVAWEAQFGDFANGAQILIDQFLSAAEDKWGHLSGLVLLLPHGFEGQGPEHSHARPERFLQLVARDAFQVCQPSTSGQYFHLLRRQMLRRWRKPLVVLTPKSMLRHPAAASPLDAFAAGEFERVRVAEAPAEADRILLCSGKILHELSRELRSRRETSTALLGLEELTPFPKEELAAALGRFPRAAEILWVQEEPANMGALGFVAPRIEGVGGSLPLRLISRAPSGSPATGSAAVHEQEQKELLDRSLARHEPAHSEPLGMDT
jgi:2-oxoglutarate dehydrogenase E1 component